MNLPIPLSVATTRTIVLLVAGAGLALGAHAQAGSKASHTVTLKRIADTRVSGPRRIAIDAKALYAEAGRLDIASNVDLLKIVFSIVEPEALNLLPPEASADPSAAGLRQLYSLERRIHPTLVDKLDLQEIVSDIPSDLPGQEWSDRRRLVVTVTE